MATTLSLLTLAAAPQLSDPAAPHTFGVSGFGWFVSGTTCAGPAREQLPQQVALAHAAGVRLLRFDLVWNTTEPRPGEYDFSGYDCWLPVIWDAGIRVLLILDYHNSAYNGFGSPSTPAGVAAYSRFAAAAAKHYQGRDVVWEIYNEPLNFWAAPTGQMPVPPTHTPGPSLSSGVCLLYVGHGPAAPRSWDDPYCQQVFRWYAAMAISASKAIKAVSPTDLVVGPAVSERGFYWDRNQSFLREIFARGVLEHFDAVTVHAYTAGPGRMWDPEEVIPAYESLRTLITLSTNRSVAIIDGE